MKFRFEHSDDIEEVVVYAKNKNELVDAIEKLCTIENKLMGYEGNRIKELNYLEIECFISQDDKIYALINNSKYLIKRRLYELYENYQETFVYINQGCLANINKIKHRIIKIEDNILNVNFKIDFIILITSFFIIHKFYFNINKIGEYSPIFVTL